MKIKRVLATLFSAVLLSSCVEEALLLVEGGMSGTGISSGRITGFGSIYVNGVRYDVDQATFYRDGESVSGQEAFSVGEFVTVTGAPADDGSSSIATQVSFDSLLVGEVTAPSRDNLSVTVMGQSVNVDNLSVLHGLTQLSELQVGNVVEVSGVRDAAGSITASSLSLRQQRYPHDGSLLKLAGSVTALQTDGATFRLGDVVVDYSAAQWEGFAPGTTLQNAQWVEVETRSALQGQTVFASTVRWKPTRKEFPQNTRLEVEGIITTVESSSRFSVNGQVVNLQSDTRFDGLQAAELALNLAVEVEGVIDINGTLQASRVALRHAKSAPADIRWQGTLTAIDAARQRFVLLGSTFVVDQASMLLGERDAINRQTSTAFALLNVGDAVEVDALLQADGTFKVLRLQRARLPPPDRESGR
jgi:hypothetical protein